MIYFSYLEFYLVFGFFWIFFRFSVLFKIILYQITVHVKTSRVLFKNYTISLKSSFDCSNFKYLKKLSVGPLKNYSCVPNKRACTSYLILVQLPPCTILIGPALFLIFGHFSSLYEMNFLTLRTVIWLMHACQSTGEFSLNLK